MSPARPQKPTHLNDDALLARLVELNGAHRLSLTSLLEHIAEVDVRRLFARRGHSSMHRYCVRELNMSDDEAYARIRVARLGRRLPSVLACLADGRLHLTAARLLASYLTAENHRAVLAEASGLNVAAIKQLVARLAPRPDVPTRVRALPVRRTAPGPISRPDAELPPVSGTPRPPTPRATLGEPQSPSAPPPFTQAPPSIEAQLSPAAPPSKVAPPLTLEAPRPVVAPLAPERFEVRFTASAALIEKLTDVTALLSHAVPDGDLPTVLERALDLARTQLVKRRFGAAAVAGRVEALVDASAGAAPVTADAVEAKRAKGRAPTTPRDAEARRRASRPTPNDESARRTPENRSADPRDAEAPPGASRPAPKDESAGRAPESRPASPRDAETRPPASRPMPAGRAAPDERRSEGRCGARGAQVVSNPAPTHELPAQRSRYIPAAVRAEVWRRDEGRCTYVDPDTGHACDERRFLELHHEHPFAHGGAHAVEVLTLRCRAHNIWAAQLDFGANHIDRCIARR